MLRILAVDLDSALEDLDVEFPEHMTQAKEFSFRVIVLEAIDVPEQYTDVFCQFK